MTAIAVGRRGPLVIGTRGSTLAIRQTEVLIAALHALHPDVDVAVRVISTRGDVMRDVPLVALGGRGVFVDAIEDALREGEIDLAVHSAKDLPSTLPADMRLAAVLERADARDVLVSRTTTLAALPPGARIGTSSPRRACQLHAMRADLDVRDMRGNVDTRLAKLDRGDFDAIVLAAAGLIRLGLATRVSEWFDPAVMLPSPGQGALAIEVRADDERLESLLEPLTHRPTERAVVTERAFLARLGAGCTAPIGAHAVWCDQFTLELQGFVGDADGRMVRDSIVGPPERAVELGRDLAERIMANGGEALIATAGMRSGS